MLFVRTPFRLPLGGGGTDLPSYYREHGAFLVTAAIRTYMYLCMNQPAMVDKIKINYSKTEWVDIQDLDSIRHEIVRESLKYLHFRRPLEISSMSDIAAGTGLGSSSSYTVGLLNGLNAILRRRVSTKDLAEEACMIEMERVGKSVGKQDQYAAAFGGIVVLEIDPSGLVKVSPLHLEGEVIAELEHRLLMFYTKIERDAQEILAEQQQVLAPGQSQTPLLAMHAIKQIGMQMHKALLAGEIDAVGQLMHQHWTEKRRVMEKMSSPQIDAWYQLAMANGAIGGKIMGAGGGGFFLFCCAEGKRRALRLTMEAAGLRYMPVAFDFEGSKVIGNF